MKTSHPWVATVICLTLVSATVADNEIDSRLEKLRTDPDVSFGNAPTSDLAALPADVFALVSWNIQNGAKPEPSAGRPPQVQKALATLLAGSYQLLAAQEVANTDHANKLRELLPAPVSAWTISFSDTTSSTDNGFWLRNTVTVSCDDTMLHSGAKNSAGRFLVDANKAKHPPRVGHLTVGDFDFTLITLHLTFESGNTAESARELRNILDFLDAYFRTAGHDPDIIICGDFNTPARLSGQTGADDITLDDLLDADPRFGAGERRLVVTVHEPTSRSGKEGHVGEPVSNYDHFILSADCLEEFIQARRADPAILRDHSGEVQPDGERRLTSDHFPIVAFFSRSGSGVHRDLPDHEP